MSSPPLYNCCRWLPTHVSTKTTQPKKQKMDHLKIDSFDSQFVLACHNFIKGVHAAVARVSFPSEHFGSTPVIALQDEIQYSNCFRVVRHWKFCFIVSFMSDLLVCWDQWLVGLSFNENNIEADLINVVPWPEYHLCNKVPHHLKHSKMKYIILGALERLAIAMKTI